MKPRAWREGQMTAEMNSKVYFFDIDQEFFRVLSEDEEQSLYARGGSWSDTAPPFSLLKACKSMVEEA